MFVKFEVHKSCLQLLCTSRTSGIFNAKDLYERLQCVPYAKRTAYPCGPFGLRKPTLYAEKYPELRRRYRDREFRYRGYYVDTAGKNAKKSQEYIQRQPEDRTTDHREPSKARFRAAGQDDTPCRTAPTRRDAGLATECLAHIMKSPGSAGKYFILSKSLPPLALPPLQVI